MPKSNADKAITPVNRDRPDSSIFFRLPPELRLAIYHELLIPPKNDKCGTASTKIVWTCKLIRAEAEPILYSNVHFRVKLSVERDNLLGNQIHVKTFAGDHLVRSKAYQPDSVYTSSVWPLSLGKFRYISIAVKLEGAPTRPCQMALNHALAGLLLYLDAASDITNLNLRLLGKRDVDTSLLQDILHPVCIWGRRMPDVKIGLINLPSDVRSTLISRIECIPRTRDDEAVESLFSAIRIAARATARLEQKGCSALTLMDMRQGMAEIIDKVGVIASGCKLRARVGDRGVIELLRQLLGIV